MDWLTGLLERNGGLIASVLLGAVVVIVWIAFLDRNRGSRSGDDGRRPPPD